MRYRYPTALGFPALSRFYSISSAALLHLQAIKPAPFLPGRSREHDPLPAPCSSGALLIYGVLAYIGTLVILVHDITDTVREGYVFRIAIKSWIIG